jgi:hypothetical protein
MSIFHYERWLTTAQIIIKPVFLDIVVHCIHLLKLVVTKKKNECDFLDDFNGKIVEKYLAFSIEEYRTKENDWSEYSDDFGYFGKAEHTRLKQFFLDWKVNSDEVFLEFKCPVWLKRFYSRSPDGVLNPRLEDLGFDRIRDPFSAFQDISMYLSNILIEQKPTATINDKYRIPQHGFDLKESFRNTKRR